MRIDKYLWCIRYYKTRSLATESCKKNQIKVNDQGCKPSKEVFIGDVILVRKNQIHYKLEVLDIPKSRLGAKLLHMFIKDITPKEELEKLETLKLSKDYYRDKGAGRPTKKDRRDIQEYLDDETED